MIGRELTFGKRRHAVPILIFGLLAATLFGISVVLKNETLAVFAALPGLLFLTALFQRRHWVRVRVTETALELPDSETTIPYQSIEGLRIGGQALSVDGRIPNGILEILDGSANHVLPVGPDSGEFYAWLVRQVPTDGSHGIPEKLQKHLAEQLETFESDLVLTYSRRNYDAPQSRRFGWFAWGLFLTSIVWIGSAAFMRGMDAFAGIAVLTLIVLGLVRLTYTQTPHSRTMKLIGGAGPCGLVISPRGIAMVQGEMAGKLRWDEIRKVTLQATRDFQIGQVGNAIRVQVDGATIQIADAYDRPLARIYEKIREYWSQEL